MPFTLAHPAAVLPLVRRPLVASALVAGAVAPDLLYVGPIYRVATQQINGNFTLTLTHRITSALWLDPLLALALLLGFVRQFPGFFRAQVTGAWDVNRILQYVSTVGGCLVLAVWLYRWYRRTSPSAVAPGWYVVLWHLERLRRRTRVS